MFLLNMEQHYHYVPGRIRIFVPEIYRNKELSKSLEEQLIDQMNAAMIRCNPFTGRVLICYDENNMKPDQVLDVIRGFQKEIHQDRRPLRNDQAEEPEDLPVTLQGYRLVGLGIVIVGLLLRRTFRRTPSMTSPWVFTMSAAIIIISSYPFFRSGLHKVPFLKRPGHDFWLGFAGCTFLILRQDLLGLFVLFSGFLNAYVQAKTLDHSQKELERILNQLSPMLPEAKAEGDEMQLHFEKGQQIHKEGTIVEGTAIFDESGVTGSPLPVLKYPGQKVLKGSWLLSGGVHIIPDYSQTDHKDFAVPIAPVVPAEIYGVKTYTRQITRAAIGIALGVLLFTRDIDRALSVLLACSPAAASISATAAYRFGLARLSKQGVLIKDLRSLQILKESDTMLFDKTGTLTGIRSFVSDVLPVEAAWSQEDIVRLSAACEVQVEHPAGQSVLAHAIEKGMNIPEAKWQQVFVGQGVKGEVEGRQIRVGNRHFMEAEGISVEKAVYKTRRLNHLGQSVVYVAVDKQVAGVIGLKDDIRPYGRELIENLRLLGMTNMAILTGDTREAALNLGRNLGIGQVWSEKMPEEKARVVTELQQQGSIVTMVGDGINDVAALYSADIGICMSHSKEKLTLEAADIVLVNGRLSGLTESIHVAHLSAVIAQQNLLIASGGNYSSLALATGGILSPLASMIITNVGTLAVLLNSFRILHI